MSSRGGDRVIKAGEPPRRRGDPQDDDIITRIRRLEASPGGTGADCEEDFHDVGTSGEPPFENGWGNIGSPEAPVGFMLCNGWVHLRGGFAGGTANSVVFTLPVGYRPEFQQEMVIPTTTSTSYAIVVVGTDGGVVYKATVT